MDEKCGFRKLWLEMRRQTKVCLHIKFPSMHTVPMHVKLVIQKIMLRYYVATWSLAWRRSEFNKHSHRMYSYTEILRNRFSSPWILINQTLDIWKESERAKKVSIYWLELLCISSNTRPSIYRYAALNLKCKP